MNPLPGLKPRASGLRHALALLLPSKEYQKHLRVDPGHNKFAKDSTHIHGIEGFWGIAKIRLAKYRGLSLSTFYLHLKESEWRKNHRKHNLPGFFDIVELVF